MKLTLVCICSCSYILQTCYWFSYCKLEIPVEKLGFNVLYTVPKVVFGGEMFLCMWENISRVWKSLLTLGTLYSIAKPGLQLQRMRQVFSSVRIWFQYNDIRVRAESGTPTISSLFDKGIFLTNRISDLLLYGCRNK